MRKVIQKLKLFSHQLASRKKTKFWSLLVPDFRKDHLFPLTKIDYL